MKQCRIVRIVRIVRLYSRQRKRRNIPLFLKRGEGGRCEVYRKTVSEDVKSFAVPQNVKLLNCVEAVVQMYKLEIITVASIKPRQRKRHNIPLFLKRGEGEGVKFTAKR